jgi:hypothetical protein
MTTSNSKALESIYDNRFMDDYLGAKMSSDAVTAVVELIANAWDAGAKTVKITWPMEQDHPFAIIDDGHGLTEQEFQTRWRTLSYDRTKNQGAWAEIPEDNSITGKRAAYGRNGKGRYSAFCFGDGEYYVETRKGEDHFCYQVKQTQGKSPLLFSEQELPSKSMLFHPAHGTAVFTQRSKHVGITLDRIKSEIGLRFLTDPDFKVFINNQAVDFSDIDEGRTTSLSFMFKGQPVTIRVINTEKSDRTAQQHGVAWHVNHRLVGNCGWDGLRNDSILDGRTNAAKRFTFIVIADAISDAVKADWSGFNINDDVLEFYDGAKQTILDFIIELSKERRAETSKQLLEENRQKLSVVSATGVSRWKEFVDKVQVECPNLKDEELHSVAKILANLEASTSKYSLVHQLSECTPKDLDDLSDILRDWNIKSAKAVLDEIQTRLKLIKDIRDKVHNMSTLEVQELQPLFGKGLWIFGPEFESIEYTSNVGMTKVLQDLFGIDTTGSLNRPDFVVLPDASIGLYGCYDFDEHGAEIGVRKAVIVELKRPGIDLGSDEKQQCWKYVKELYQKGAILRSGQVECYLLGETIEPQEGSPLKERDDTVIIRPLVYDTVLKRAETRMLNLHKKIENAPFLANNPEITEFLEKNTIASHEQLSLAELENA